MSKGTHTPYIGTYIVDNFNSGAPNSWWDTEFKTNWTAEELPPGSGDYTMVRGSTGLDQLTPANNLTDGFIFEATIKCGATNVGPNFSIHLHALNSSGVMQCGMYWETNIAKLRWFHTSYAIIKDQVSSVTFAAYKEIKVKIERSPLSNTVTGYYDIGAGWVAFINPQTISGSVGIEVDGSQEHGFTEFDFWAGDGFPNP